MRAFFAGERGNADVAGMVLVAGSALGFVSMHTLIRVVADDGMHPFEIAFFRNVFGFAVLLPILIRQRFAPLRTSRIGLHLVRAGINTAAMLLFFWGLSITLLAQVTALSFTAPLFATLLAVLVLGETVRLRRMTALVIGFAGTLAILRPGLVPMELGPLLVVTSAALWSVAMTIIKVLSRTDSSLTITAYMGLLMMPLSLVAAVWFWRWPSWEELAILAVLGGVGTCAQVMLAQALKIGETTAVMPLDFTKMLWATLFGWLAFGEWPDLYTWFGALLIFGAACYIAYREARLKPPPARTVGPTSPPG